MSSDATTDRIQRITIGMSLLWLFAANCVGVLLAVLLVWPAANSAFAPLSYGRWVPLHMDWQLYGWCTIPLLGIAFLKYLDHDKKGGAWTALALSFWSLGLFFGGWNWLAGGSTGKLFLNWGGASGAAWAGSLFAIWTILLLGWLSRIKVRKRIPESAIELSVKGLILLGLLGVPALLLYTSSPAVYPPVNPDSGGATGHSLLASTLGIVFIMGSLPRCLLKLKPVSRADGGGGDSHPFVRYFWAAYALSVLLYLFIDHGDASHHALNQVFGLSSLLVWPLLVWKLWSYYQWEKLSRYWRISFYFWWGLLALNGWILFLPNVLDMIKFTNALVAHSHLAMAGMVTALNMTLLCELGRDQRAIRVLIQPIAWIAWNAGCLIYVISMSLQGWREGVDPSVLRMPDQTTAWLYLIRLLAGLAMTVPSGYWLYQHWIKSPSSLLAKPDPLQANLKALHHA